jgi:hypothetical protein
VDHTLSLHDALPISRSNRVKQIEPKTRRIILGALPPLHR